MWEIVGAIAGVVVLFVVLEFFTLPDLVAKKLRSNTSDHDLKEQVAALEKRISELESKIKQQI